MMVECNLVRCNNNNTGPRRGDTLRESSPASPRSAIGRFSCFEADREVFTGIPTGMNVCPSTRLDQYESTESGGLPAWVVAVFCHVSVCMHGATATLAPFSEHTPGSHRSLSQTACAALRRGLTRLEQPAQFTHTHTHQVKLCCEDRRVQHPPGNITGTWGVRLCRTGLATLWWRQKLGR